VGKLESENDSLAAEFKDLFESLVTI